MCNHRNKVYLVGQMEMNYFVSLFIINTSSFLSVPQLNTNAELFVKLTVISEGILPTQQLN